MSAAEIYAANLESIVKVETTIVSQNAYGLERSSIATGTGFVISEDGYIFTNHHVIEGGASFKVIFKNGDSYEAELTGSEANGNDIALLKIDASGLRPVELGDSSTLSIGDGVYVIGHPLGELDYSLTVGVVSALDREIAIDNDILRMFQIDAAVNRGNSGGPVFNHYGQVIGMVTAKYADSDIEGLGFAIEINELKDVLEDLKEFGFVRGQPYFGIGVKNATGQTDANGNVVSPAGALVSTVEKESCAETAGIKVGDIITALGDRKVESVAELLQAKKSYRAGDSASVTVFRNGEYLTLTIVFDEYVPEGVSSPGTPEQTLPGFPGQGGNW
jgi:serine protease Do